MSVIKKKKKEKRKFIQHGYARGERRVEADGRSHPARNRAINPIKARGEGGEQRVRQEEGKN